MILHIFRMFHYGMSYFIATNFFSKDIRQAVLKLYSFVRIPDNIVDIVDGGFPIKGSTIYCEDKTCGLNNKDKICRQRCSKILANHYINAYKKLKKYRRNWDHAFQKKDTKNKQFGEYVSLFTTYAIPYKYSTEFLESMMKDCIVNRYQTYEEVEKYMYGSASVIGLMMCSIMGVNNDHALKYARMLGDAMQFTNFLRDIREDVIYLDRIYLPAQDLKRYGLVHEDIIDFSKDFDKRDSEKRVAFQSYMKEQIKNCRKIYKEAKKGYEYLPLEARKAVSLSSLLYQEILNNIEKNNYNVFSLSARTTLGNKLSVWGKWRNNY